MKIQSNWLKINTVTKEELFICLYMQIRDSGDASGHAGHAMHD